MQTNATRLLQRLEVIIGRAVVLDRALGNGNLSELERWKSGIRDRRELAAPRTTVELHHIAAPVGLPDLVEHAAEHRRKVFILDRVGRVHTRDIPRPERQCVPLGGVDREVGAKLEAEHPRSKDLEVVLGHPQAGVRVLLRSLESATVGFEQSLQIHGGNAHPQVPRQVTTVEFRRPGLDDRGHRCPRWAVRLRSKGNREKQTGSTARQLRARLPAGSPPSRMTLPIESIRAALLEGLQRTRHFVLQAEPGAGKTTRIPVILHESGITEGGEILVAQPRRIAARMAALRVASTLGEEVGQTCGYQVRFDSKVGPRTRIRFVTEGLLLRRLRDDPSLKGVSTVILDEFHERHIHTDVALALLKRLAAQRKDLRIGVMSATLAPEPIAAYLGCAPLHCEGRTFPVEVSHATKASDRPLPGQVSVALRELTAAGVTGSVLVFLPGAAEIRACAKHLAGQADHLGLDLVQLHGDLPAREQDRAVAEGPRPKLILSTNVAETSVTIEHVVAVIDSGLARKPSHNPWTGIPTLSLAKISRASAEQRAGRAGRVQAGHCVRLYSKHDLDRRPEFDPPELCRLDLAGAMLDLRAAGLTGPGALEWFEPPPEAAVEAAETLLRRLGAVDAGGGLKKMGRAMLSHPVHPRLARVLEEAKARSVAGLGTTAVALLSERSIHRRDARRTTRTAASDVVLEAEDLRAFERDGASAAHRLGLDIGACKMVLRVQTQLRKSLGVRGSSQRPTPAEEDALGLALLAGFPDRIGRLREAARGGLEIVFAEGGSAALDEHSAVRDTELAVALAVEERKGARGQPQVLVRSAAAVELEDLLELFVDDLEEHSVVSFDAERERVTAVEEVRLGALVVETTVLRTLPPEAADVLFEAARAKGLETFIDDRDAVKALEGRTRFAHRHDEQVPILDESAMLEVLRGACEGRSSFAQLRKANLASLALSTLPPAGRSALERFAPSHVSLPGGRRLRVHYELDRDPWVESRLQDFFGSAHGPTVGDGRTPLVLHLLAPNMRAVQVTTDLAGFWARHYPDLRKTLMRRYPKHDWPEKPLEAKPPVPRPHRRRK